MLDHWQVKEGLPQNSVNAIAQTRDGYLWLGTYEGLVRFNGKTFTVFDRGNTPVLQSNRITSLCEDRKGRLWIGSYGGGVVMYDGKTFRTPIRDSTFGRYINIASLAADSIDGIWANTEHGLFHISDSAINRAYPPAVFGNVRPALGCVDGKGNVWLFENSTLYIIRSGKVHTISSRQGKSFYTSVAYARDGGVWLCEYREGKVRLCKYNDTLEYVHTVPQTLAVQSIALLGEDSRGTLWWYMSDGIATYSGGRWNHLGKNTSPSIEFVQVMKEDREGNFWVGTNGNGLLRLRDARFTPIGIPEGMQGENVWAVFEDSRQRKWIGTLGGEGWCYEIDHNGLRSITNRMIVYFCFLEDRRGNVWLAGESLVAPDGTLRRLNSSLNSFVLALDSSGRIWLSPFHGGIYIVEGEKIVDSLSLKDRAANATIRTMKTDRDGSMWIGTQNGLFHSTNDTMVHYSTANGLPNNWIRSVYQDTGGTLWIATDGGLAKKIGEQFSSYTEQHGLHSNTIHCILEDDNGKLWMSSNKGIFVVKKSDLQLFDERTIDRIPCDVYGEEDGMRSAEGNGSYQQGGWKMRDGTLWFATIKGVVVVDPYQLKKNTYVLPVVIEKVISGGKEISASEKFELSYPAADIGFQFAALSYRIHSRVRYKYRLEGYHNTWVDAGNQTRAQFTNLPPGEFIFRVIACNDDGVWNTAGASIAFTLPAPFWMQWWFRALMVLALVLGIGGTARFIELRKIRWRIEQLEREKALERERARISKDMHDEVGANLTKIAILSELAARNADDTPKHLRKITETSREVIDSMGQIIWAINPKNDKLENMAAYLREFISETFEMTAIRASISFADELPIQSLSAEFRRNIFLTVKEAVNNIVKYSKATEIHAQLHVETGKLLFSISDNGIGFDVSNASRFGNGLHNMKKRIEDIGGSFIIESAAGKGTIISISVQL